MFEKIGKFFTAVVTFLGAILAFFVVFKTKEQADLVKSFNEDKGEFEGSKDSSLQEYEEKKQMDKIKYQTALRDLTDEKDKDLAKLEEKYDKEVVEIYKKNKEDPENLVKELSEKYGLEDV